MDFCTCGFEWMVSSLIPSTSTWNGRPSPSAVKRRSGMPSVWHGKVSLQFTWAKLDCLVTRCFNMVATRFSYARSWEMSPKFNFYCYDWPCYLYELTRFVKIDCPSISLNKFPLIFFLHWLCKRTIALLEPLVEFWEDIFYIRSFIIPINNRSFLFML